MVAISDPSAFSIVTGNSQNAFATVVVVCDLSERKIRQQIVMDDTIPSKLSTDRRNVVIDLCSTLDQNYCQPGRNHTFFGKGFRFLEMDPEDTKTSRKISIRTENWRCYRENLVESKVNTSLVSHCATKNVSSFT